MEGGVSSWRVAGVEAGSLGAGIKRRRKALRWSQADLSKRVGCSRPCVALWETDRHCPTVSMLGTLAVVLRCSIEVVP
jgi:transcriptional regulator with XRE-family HTH domain